MLMKTKTFVNEIPNFTCLIAGVHCISSRTKIHNFSFVFMWDFYKFYKFYLWTVLHCNCVTYEALCIVSCWPYSTASRKLTFLCWPAVKHQSIIWRIINGKHASLVLLKADVTFFFPCTCILQGIQFVDRHARPVKHLIGGFWSTCTTYKSLLAKLWIVMCGVTWLWKKSSESTFSCGRWVTFLVVLGH